MKIMKKMYNYAINMHNYTFVLTISIPNQKRTKSEPIIERV